MAVVSSLMALSGTAFIFEFLSRCPITSSNSSCLGKTLNLLFIPIVATRGKRKRIIAHWLCGLVSSSAWGSKWGQWFSTSDMLVRSLLRVGSSATWSTCCVLSGVMTTPNCAEPGVTCLDLTWWRELFQSWDSLSFFLVPEWILLPDFQAINCAQGTVSHHCGSILVGTSSKYFSRFSYATTNWRWWCCLLVLLKI